MRIFTHEFIYLLQPVKFLISVREPAQNRILKAVFIIHRNKTEKAAIVKKDIFYRI